MYLLNKTFYHSFVYLKKQDLFIKFIITFFCLFSFSRIFRVYISELEFFQPLPGFSMVYLFFSFAFLFFLHDKMYFLVQHYEKKYKRGRKIAYKIRDLIYYKDCFFFLFLSLNSLFLLIIPIIFDSLLNYGEQSLDNFWSISKLVSIEIFLIFSFLIVSQVPLIIKFFFFNQNIAKKLFISWKIISFFSIIFSGIITPTIDIITQLILSLFFIFYYYLAINFLQKKLIIRFCNFMSLTF